MNKDARILFVYPSRNEPAKQFANTLRNGLGEWNIKVTDASLSTLLFEARNVEITHFFMSPASKSSPLLKKFKGKNLFVQTLLATARNPERYRTCIFGDEVTVFSQQQKNEIEKYVSVPVTVIPPPVLLPDPTTLHSSGEIREKFSVGERLLVVALSDVTDKKQFNVFLYIAREYQRREGFRFLIPHLSQKKEVVRWRGNLKASLEHEKLESTTLLEDIYDLHSLLDAADLCLYPKLEHRSQLDFPLLAAEALLSGKPVLCSPLPPFSEILREFRFSWIANDAEDFVRISRDILKEAPKLEQLATEVARFAKPRLSPFAVAKAYENIYANLLQPVRRS